MSRFVNQLLSLSVPRRVYLGRAVLFSLLVAAPAALGQGPPGDAEKRQQMAGELDRLYNGDLVAGGSILSPDGKPLEDVKLLIDIGRFDPAAPSLRRTESERQFVTAAFRVSCEQCSDLRLRFVKDGYHSELVTLATRTEDRAPESDARPVKSRGQMQVVMQPVVAAVELQVFRGRLALAAAGRDQVLPLGTSDGRRGGREVPLKVLKLEKDGPLPHYLRLDAAMDTGGGPKVLKSSPTALPRPEAPALELSGEGGFILHQPEQKRVEEIWRDMRQAPAEGYARRLELDPRHDRPIYFYVHAGGRYGKGKVTPVTVERGSLGHRVTAFVELRMNPDGSRNLETAP